MKHSWLFVMSFASLCPFNAFGFPSVSRFWAAPNPDWLNELRSDYPLNSACIGWSYFDRGPHRNVVCVSLPSNDSALLNRCSRRSRFLADERCAGFDTSVEALGPCAADSRTSRRTTLWFAVCCLSSKTVAQRFVALGLSPYRTAFVCTIARFAEWPTIPHEVWRC